MQLSEGNQVKTLFEERNSRVCFQTLTRCENNWDSVVVPLPRPSKTDKLDLFLTLR